MINFKKAIKEIIEEQMEDGGLLDGYCDEVLESSAKKMDSASKTAICIGDYNSYDSDVGDLNDRNRIYLVDIICLAAVSNEVANMEEVAEERSHDMARLVRRLFKNADTRLLISDSYPTGLAIDFRFIDGQSETMVYGDQICRADTLRAQIKIREDYGEYFS